MKYQLVLQFTCNESSADYDRLLALEEAIEKSLGEIGVVDGHDFGRGEMNIFVHTNEPKAAFEAVKDQIQPFEQTLKAGYRDFKQEEYVPIFPSDLKRFSVS